MSRKGVFIPDITVEMFKKATLESVEEFMASGQMEYIEIPERPHGEWIYNQYDGNANIGNWHCSECRHIVYGGYSQKPYYNFCSNCGADMRKEGDEK